MSDIENPGPGATGAGAGNQYADHAIDAREIAANQGSILDRKINPFDTELRRGRRRTRPTHLYELWQTERRRQRLVQQLYALGPRVVFEFLDEIGREYEFSATVDDLLQHYTERLTPKLLQAVGGDRFPALPIRAVGGQR